MFKKLLITLIATLGLATAGLITTVFAGDLPEENWSAMNPTVQVTSYKYKFAGHVIGIGSGSGTVISPNGLVLTNNHVIYDETEQRPLDAFEICITFDVTKEPLCNYTAKLVANDKDLDLAILRVNSRDVFGNPLPILKYLEFQTGAAPREGHKVQVIGYPASGGQTVTITQGQISGFDKFNSHTYFKTDTDFDHGSSGGTVLNEKGDFIGIPTYIRSYAENVGYFLDLREALPWIQGHLNDEGTLEPRAQNELTREMARFVRANKTLTYKADIYPYPEITLPEGWEFFQIDNGRIFAAQKNVNDGVGVNIRLEQTPFPIGDAYFKKLSEQFINARERFPDFKEEAVKFAGHEAKRITYTSYNQKNTIYYIPYGYALVGLSYGINLDKEQKQTEALQPFLDSFRLETPLMEEPELAGTVHYDDPAFEISTAGDFRMQKPVGGSEGDLLLKALQEGNYEGQFSVNYGFTPKDERTLSNKEKLDEATKYVADRNAKVIFKKEDVILDGLTGFAYTTEYEGSLYQQIRKTLTIELPHGEYKFTIEYDDLAGNFEKNLPIIKEILNSFQYLGDEPPEGKGQHEFGALNQRFSDIQHHRFAVDISELADKSIAEGYKDGRFRPEFFARKTDALKMILKSKNHLESERGLGKEADFKDDHLAYAEKQGLLGDVKFEPYVAITLGEALEWITRVYEVQVWQGQTVTIRKRYMDKGYELGLIPRGLDDEGARLTRAELAYLVNTVYNQAK